MAMSIEERVARLEGIVEEIRRELNQIHARLNMLTTLIVGTWISTMITILAMGAALFFQIKDLTR